MPPMEQRLIEALSFRELKAVTFTMIKSWRICMPITISILRRFNYEEPAL